MLRTHKGIRPSVHVRRVKTKFGHKPTLINREIGKRKVVKINRIGARQMSELRKIKAQNMMKVRLARQIPATQGKKEVVKEIEDNQNEIKEATEEIKEDKKKIDNFRAKKLE